VYLEEVETTNLGYRKYEKPIKETLRIFLKLKFNLQFFLLSANRSSNFNSSSTTRPSSHHPKPQTCRKGTERDRDPNTSTTNSPIPKYSMFWKANLAFQSILYLVMEVIPNTLINKNGYTIN
jgi:hypothetical protein